jgi:hypothetical protein
MKFNLFKRTVFIDSSKAGKGNLQIEEINVDSQSIIEALGITQDRAADLEGLAVSSYRKCNNIIKAMSLASAQCKHANELFFVSRIMCTLHDGPQYPLLRFIGPGEPEQ